MLSLLASSQGHSLYLSLGFLEAGRALKLRRAWGTLQDWDGDGCKEDICVRSVARNTAGGAAASALYDDVTRSKRASQLDALLADGGTCSVAFDAGSTDSMGSAVAASWGRPCVPFPSKPGACFLFVGPIVARNASCARRVCAHLISNAAEDGSDAIILALESPDRNALQVFEPLGFSLVATHTYMVLRDTDSAPDPGAKEGVDGIPVGDILRSDVGRYFGLMGYDVG